MHGAVPMRFTHSSRVAYIDEIIVRTFKAERETPKQLEKRRRKEVTYPRYELAKDHSLAGRPVLRTHVWRACWAK